MKLTFTANRNDPILPTRNEGDAGWDVYSNFNGYDFGFEVKSSFSSETLEIDGQIQEYYSKDSYIEIQPGQTVKIPTGLIANLQQIYYTSLVPASLKENRDFIPDFTKQHYTPCMLGLQFRSKSGLAAKQGLITLNSPGTIDTSYSDEIFGLVYNTSSEVRRIYHHQKIGQLVPELVPSLEVGWQEEKTPGIFNRNGGFGSTGLFTG